MKTATSLCTLLLTGLLATAQQESVVEQYNYLGGSQAYLYMPVVHFQSSRHWYTEARYNYDEAQTFSLLMGKTFSNNRKLSYSFTPLLGGAIGKFNGISTGLTMNLEYSKLFFSTQSQYSFSTDQYNTDFLYSWSEIGYQHWSWMYSGLSLQHTHTVTDGTVLEPGIVVGFSFGRCTIPVYSFHPFDGKRYFIVGFNVTWQHKKTARKNYTATTAE